MSIDKFMVALMIFALVASTAVVSTLTEQTNASTQNQTLPEQTNASTQNQTLTDQTKTVTREDRCFCNCMTVGCMTVPGVTREICAQACNTGCVEAGHQGQPNPLEFCGS